MENDLCKLCSATSEILHCQLTDRLVGTAGTWYTLRCTNKDCGLAWIYPHPTDEQLSAAYENYYTHSSEKSASALRALYEHVRAGYLSLKFGYLTTSMKWWEKSVGMLIACMPHRREALNASVMWLSAMPNGRVLEIGCGNGELLARFSKFGWHTEGIELDHKAASIAKERGLSVVTGELTENTFPPATFDAIVMCHVIEHVEDPISLLRYCKKILKSDGYLNILTPNVNAIGHRWFGKDWLHLDPPRHLNLFSARSLRIALEQAGFDGATCQTTLRDANWTLAASLTLRKKGRYCIGELSRSMRIAGLVLLYCEWLLLKFNKGWGEELLVIARQSKETST